MTGTGVNGPSEFDEFAEAATKVIGDDAELLRKIQWGEARLNERKKLAARHGELEGESLGDARAPRPLILRFSGLFRLGAGNRR